MYDLVFVREDNDPHHSFWRWRQLQMLVHLFETDIITAEAEGNEHIPCTFKGKRGGKTHTPHFQYWGGGSEPNISVVDEWHD